jgi:hypothetical protein
MSLPREHLLDELATAYVQVVAATAGATIAVSRLDHGVYGTLSHVVQASKEESHETKFIPDGFAVEFQIKGIRGNSARGVGRVTSSVTGGSA